MGFLYFIATTHIFSNIRSLNMFDTSAAYMAPAAPAKPKAPGCPSIACVKKCNAKFPAPKPVKAFGVAVGGSKKYQGKGLASISSKKGEEDIMDDSMPETFF